MKYIKYKNVINFYYNKIKIKVLTKKIYICIIFLFCSITFSYISYKLFYNHSLKKKRKKKKYYQYIKNIKTKYMYKMYTNNFF